MKKINIKILIAIFVVLVLLSSTFVSIAIAKEQKFKGFNKGVSYKEVLPLKKVTFVNFDKYSLLDDYAYLASLPTAVFESNNVIFSHPLLFYEDPYPVKEDKERSLNARQGIDYFMEDWMSYCNGQLDQMTLINVPKEKVKQWSSKEYISIDGNNPYDIASKIALQEWSYSDEIVLAVIDEKYTLAEKPMIRNNLMSTLSACNIGSLKFDVEQPVIGSAGTYKYFTVDDPTYKYLVAELSWSGGIDLDLQLHDPKIGMVESKAGDYREPKIETAGSYINNYGEWKISITAVPKKSASILNNFKSYFHDLKKLAKSIRKTGEVTIKMYPGAIVDLEPTPFGCRNAEFILTWNNPNVKLEFTLIDPSGTEIWSTLKEKEIFGREKENEIKMKLDVLGECREGEHYSVCVFSLDNVTHPVDFKLDYSWQQNFTKDVADYFTSASNGAVLASLLNVPLLYTSPARLPEITKDTIYKLGVKKIHLLNIGKRISENALNEIEGITKTLVQYDDPKKLYHSIKNISGDVDVIFTTVDPWSYWYVDELKPAGEYPGALFIGPAAYIAAHHGSPVLVIEQHPQLSQAVVYHTNFWIKIANIRTWPSSGSMLMSGKQVYDFLEEYGLGKLEEGGAEKQIQEKIITVADQFDIGIPWDRVFTGAALPGRFWGSPVDTAYAICRNVFYPALIFVNPAMKGENSYINGSSSRVKRLGGRLLEPKGVTLVITKPSQEEKFTYPVLQTYNTYLYKFNERAWQQWNYKYRQADGLIPYDSDSKDEIDDGVNGRPGAYVPDISESEVIPFYCEKGGYGNVFSTNFTSVVENLNRGVIIWIENCHGWFQWSGAISMWDPDNPYTFEDNPWRAYEPIMLKPGHLREFIKWLMYFGAEYGELGMVEMSESTLQLLKKLYSTQIIRYHLFSERGSTENPDVSMANPQLLLINKLVGGISGGILDVWGAFGIQIHRDRLLHPIKTIREGLPFITTYDGKITLSELSGHITVKWYTGYQFDDALGNLHSCGLNAVSCYPAGTYLHLTWMRHGMVYQIIDPWSTTDWAGVWQQMLIKRFVLGDTVGQAYERGMRATAPEYLVGQFWWDEWEHVEYFGDPDLRVFVPETKYNNGANYWEQKDTRPLRYEKEIDLEGHMPFGATSYPHERKPTFLENYLIIALLVILAVILAIVFVARSKRKKK